MKAIVMTAAGAPDVLQLQTLPDPPLQHPTQMRVRLKAAGVNPIDTKLRQRGSFYPDRAPTVLGCDGAGVVEAVGNRVERYRVGDEVYFCQGGLGGPGGTYADYAVVDERFVAPKPQSLSFAEAAAAPLVLITAWEALYDRGRLQAVQTALIHGGAGGVGHVAIQLAKLRGARVCTTVSSEAKADLVKSLGAELPILYKTTDFVKAALDWTDGKGVHLAFDTVGGALLERSFGAVRVYGDVVTILAPAADLHWNVARDRNLRLSLELMLTPMLHNLPDDQKHQARILEDCTRWFDQGLLRLNLSHTFPLGEAAAAHRLLEQGGMVGKIALEI
ncbi:zinc-dependent alcohol dehydrogenase family protein [Prochlorothrix hollandica]|uniref:Alcohol dehydrogenase n=1 Tax=Prochlorothrix hollandica PCC 9006 = CALU 1027 TaxID=317619 RepID=A0A0M2PQA9_PROHO|nr:zinc-dependent alcohol dehydrogenase family protein [Prochlorothrix hollandica]KKI98750.1 alcohol dehydrogenase [Prochlorothrix hollandica PCC 9006 = CALU 1027]